MQQLSTIVTFLNKYLENARVQEESWNGLQFEGKQTISHIVGAVDGCHDVFTAAATLKADMCIVHHGQFWRSANPSYSGWQAKRLQALYEHNISLYASHLPLDKHKQVGNNAQLIKLLGAEITQPFYAYQDTHIGWIGTYNEPRSLEWITATLDTQLPTVCKTLPFGKQLISTMAVCSGGPGYKGFFEAMRSGADLYITGDAVDIYHTAKDSGHNVIFAGHNATERLGIKALLAVLTQEFGIQTTFIDAPTGL